LATENPASLANFSNSSPTKNKQRKEDVIPQWSYRVTDKMVLTTFIAPTENAAFCEK
jgi:hypothetical protein